MTTGALYKRYKGKEDLFCAVVADTVEALKGFVEQRSSVSAASLSDDMLIRAWEMGVQGNFAPIFRQKEKKKWRPGRGRLNWEANRS